MWEILENLCREQRLQWVDLHFARFCLQFESREPLLVLAALVSRELSRGHVCLKLTKLKPFCTEYPELEPWLGEISGSSMFADSLLLAEHGPLCFEFERLYLRRYRNYEQSIADFLLEASGDAASIDIHDSLQRLFAKDSNRLWQQLQKLRLEGALESAQVCSLLDIVEPERVAMPELLEQLNRAGGPADLESLLRQLDPGACFDGQQVGAAVATRQRFTLISGGPGTGKTTTVVKLLALYIEQQRSLGSEPLIRMVAPTGKAAARLSESVGMALDTLPLNDDVRQLLPRQASTIHRLLGVVPHQQGFRHNRDNPLHLDLLVVDEASMVDLAMMAKLIDALPRGARLILLGDRDQLASVEAGAVLADIFSFAEAGYSPQQVEWLNRQTGFSLKPGSRSLSPIQDSLCLLNKSYRFDQHSGIGQLARAVNSGSATQLESVLGRGFSDISVYSLGGAQLLAQTVHGYRPYLQRMPDTAQDESRIRELLSAYQGFRVLVALREGPFGLNTINQQVEQQLTKAGLIRPEAGREWYEGRPVMIERNDHGLGLYNGDIGICLKDSQEKLRVYFEMADGKLRSFLPGRLPEHTTAYAMTIHKSQGSEFAEVLMLLPPRRALC
ncbi:exodeoxyribonuclease V subunit alpha [Dongshaea marina]|uniref:exodeoxyribonuclease V subunit alpha n=1 Tax=Dongshaea marina TaxID=2047966 RepID=UPI001F2C5133|nr:exodeoxyribonuclease V subunit alpha [Dongshaea marina]